MLRLQKLQHLEYISRYNIEKLCKAFEVAGHNARQIIIKSVDFSYAFKEKITVLFNDIDCNRHNPQNDVLKIIDDFLERNKRAFMSFPLTMVNEIQNWLKKKLLTKLNK